MDVITSFNLASDAIDLTWTGSALTYVGQLGSATTQLAAHTVGWLVSRGNTFVYGDTGSSKQSLSNASMKIELQGTPALSGGISCIAEGAEAGSEGRGWEVFLGVEEKIRYTCGAVCYLSVVGFEQRRKPDHEPRPPRYGLAPPPPA